MTENNEPRWVDLPREHGEAVVASILRTLYDRGVVLPARTATAAVGYVQHGDGFTIQAMIVGGSPLPTKVTVEPTVTSLSAANEPDPSPATVSLPAGFFKAGVLTSRRLRILGGVVVALLLAFIVAMIGSTLYRAGRVSAGLECTRDMAQMVAWEVRKP